MGSPRPNLLQDEVIYGKEKNVINGSVNVSHMFPSSPYFFFCVEDKSSMYSPYLQIIETVRAGFWKYDDISEVSL